MREDHQIVALIEVRIASIHLRIKLPREGRMTRGARPSLDAREVQIEEIAEQRIALIIDGVAPGIRSLQPSDFRERYARERERQADVLAGFSRTQHAASSIWCSSTPEIQPSHSL